MGKVTRKQKHERMMINQKDTKKRNSHRKRKERIRRAAAVAAKATAKA